MRIIWIKLSLLALYPIFISILLNLLTFVPWEPVTKRFDTSLEILHSFSIKDAKQILDSRGVSYSGVAEKEELFRLVQSSGIPTKEELDDHLSAAKISVKTVIFKSASHFYETVQRTKHNPWLVQIVMNNLDKYPLSGYVWDKVLSKVSEFGIKAGHFSCTLNPTLCKVKKWASSRLVLALPQANQTLEDAVFYDFQKTPTIDSVLHWVRYSLASQVKHIRSIQRLQNWMTFSDIDKTNIRVILFSTQQICPMYFSALAIQFHDRIPFAIVDVTNDAIKNLLKEFQFPLYLVVSPEDFYIYGSRKGESFNFKSMEIFLNSFIPKTNDICWLFVLLTNALASFELVFTNVKRETVFEHLLVFFMIFVRYNLCFFFLFVLYSFICDNTIIVHCISVLLKCFRLLSGSYVVSIIRSDFKHFYYYPFITATFVLYVIISGFILNHYELLQEDA